MYTKSSYTKLTENRIDKNEKKSWTIINGNGTYCVGHYFFTRNNNKMCITCGTDRAASDHWERN